MAAMAFTREDLALRTQPTLGSPQHSPLHRPQPHPHERPTSGLGHGPSHQARSTVPLDTPRSSQGASCLPLHCPEPCREGPTTARLTLGMVRGLEHCRVLLKVGKARVGEGALASASVLRVLTWTEQGASYAGGRAAGAPQAWLTLAAAGQWQQASPLPLPAASAVGVQPQAQGQASG